MKIGRILHLKSRNPKNLKSDSQYLPRWLRQSNLRFRDFGFEMQDSSDFKISDARVAGFVKYVVTLFKEGKLQKTPLA